MGSEPVRVLHLVHDLSLGGATLMAMLLADRLGSKGFRAMLAASPSASEEGSLLAEVERRGVEFTPLPHLRRRPSPLADLRALRSLSRLVADLRPTIVHTHTAKPKLLAACVGPRAGRPVRVAHLWAWEWQAASSATASLAYTAASRWCARRCDALIACSRAMQQEGLRRGVGREGQYRVIHPPVDLARFTTRGRERGRQEVRAELGIPAEALVVASVCRLSPQKAPLDLVRAAEVVVRARADARFLVVGDGPLRGAVTQEVRRRGLGARMLLLGARHDVPRLLQAADLFALTSAWEPFGIAFLEAAAVGLPCVGPCVDGIPEAVQHGRTGVLVEPGDPTLLGRAILELADNPQIAQRLAQAGVEWASQFTEERFVSSVCELYAELLDKHPPESPLQRTHGNV